MLSKGPERSGILNFPSRIHSRWKTGAHMSLCLVRRDRIAAMTGRARQTQSVFAISEFVERLRGTELVHRFNLRVTFQTAFEGYGRRGGLLRCSA